MAGRDIKNLRADIQAQLTTDFNAFIQVTTKELSRAEISPVLTGFFASSWKTSTSRPRARDERENFSPWNKIRTETVNGRVRLAAGQKPIIEPRHPVLRFRLSESVFIGNTTKYAVDALASPKSKITGFVQGELGALIKSVFSSSSSSSGHTPRIFYYEVPGESS